MGWSVHHPQGVIYYAAQQCYRGYTLFANVWGDHASLIDMEGRICHRWHSEEGIDYAYLLPNGNLLLRTHAPQDPGIVGRLGGSSEALLELDWEGRVVWEYRNPRLHHDFERLPNGNTLVLLWEPIPAELTAQVRGGYRSDDNPAQMLGDLVQEITQGGHVAWQWRSWEHLSVEEDVICPLEGRPEWTHGNSLAVTAEGNTDSRYAASCASNRSVHGIETTRAFTPSPARTSAADVASATSEPVAMRMMSGVPSQSAST